ncbi:MAG: hypothetical protein JOY55_16185 [Mycobacterium sp.]|nr:hypothetical protein [Mycobacterium sp.]
MTLLHSILPEVYANQQAAARDEAYSAWNAMTSFGVNFLGWIGASRQAPEMMYFRI